MQKLKVYFIIFLFLVASGTACRPGEQAAVFEKPTIIKTYEFAEPDPVPILTRSGLWGKGTRLYPYTFFDEHSAVGKEKEYNVVRLENPYISVALLPQVGGKIWGAEEKSTGREFLYTNHVLKFREIALRGPWTSGGIEFNFGIVGHTPAGAHPVDYIWQKNKDGSVSCTVGAMDLPSRARWSVTITVPPDKAFFETKSFWYNPSPLHQSYYVWMNGAVKVSDDLKFVFPGRYHIAHDFSVPLAPWPVDASGKDLSLYRNNNFGSYKSYFTVGEYENFFGGYWEKDAFGFGHWALYDDMPGHKIWIWGLSRQGMIWEDLLTDNDGQYSEPQAGRYLNQNDHEFLPPYAADSWREIWFPYREIGPMKTASPKGVMNVEYREEALTIGICPLTKIDDDLIISSSGKEIHRERVKLEPLEVYLNSFPFKVEKGNFQVSLSAELCYTDDPTANDLHRPLNFQNDYSSSVTGNFLEALRCEKERNLHKALDLYKQVLVKEPLHIRALCRSAELFFRRGEYEQAKRQVEKALNVLMYDPEANYIYAIISRRLGELVDAKETLGWAARSLLFRSAAYCQLAEISMQEKNYFLALDYSERALKFNTQNSRAWMVRAITRRKLDQPSQAREMLASLLEFDPLNHMARFEIALLNEGKKDLTYFQEQIRNENPFESYLEMALIYVSMGLTDEAINMLELAPENPMIYYWLAFLERDKSLEKSRSWLDKANDLSPLLVFPFREESLPVLYWADTKSPQKWKISYYLALILWNKGRIDEAIELLESCGEPDFSPYYTVRAYFYKDQDKIKALLDYKKALELDTSSWRNWSRLIGFYLLEPAQKAEALETAEQAVQKLPESIPLKIAWIRANMLNNRFQKAAEMFEQLSVLPSEGATNVHELYSRCYTRLGVSELKQGKYEQALSDFDLALDYPERLGSGRPYNPDQRLHDYLKAICFERLQKKKEAEELRTAIKDYTLAHWPQPGKHAYIGGLILQRYGLLDKAQILLKEPAPEKAILDVLQ